MIKITLIREPLMTIFLLRIMDLMITSYIFQVNPSVNQIIWFNPLINAHVKTNVDKTFVRLVDHKYQKVKLL